jgi:hypothetical protein
MTKLLFAYCLAQSLTDKWFIAFGLLKSILLAGSTWALCGFSMWLWNRRFHMRFAHHLVCAFAAIITCSAVFVFQCLGEVQNYAIKDLNQWRDAYTTDRQFSWDTFVLAHDKLRDLYRENGWTWDTHKYLEPPREAPGDSSKYILPAERQEEKEASLKIYCDRCIENLNASQPTLSRILWQGGTIDMVPLRKDLSDFQQNNPKSIYDLSTGSLRIAADECLTKLEANVKNQCRELRVGLVFLFVAVQCVAIGFGDHSACKDLKPSLYESKSASKQKVVKV